MNKCALNSFQRDIVRHLSPAGEYNLFYSTDENLAVYRETREGKNYWLSELILWPKESKEHEFHYPSFQYQTEFHLESDGSGKKYLLVKPLLKCETSDRFCNKLLPLVSEWKSKLPQNFAVQSFAQEIMGEEPLSFTVISAEEFYRHQGQLTRKWTAWLGVLGTVGGILGLGSFAYLKGIIKEDAMETDLHGNRKKQQ